MVPISLGCFTTAEKLDNKKLIKILSNHSRESLTFPATRISIASGNRWNTIFPPAAKLPIARSTCPNSSPRFQRATRSRSRQQTRPIARYPLYLISIDLPWIRTVPEISTFSSFIPVSRCQFDSTMGR